VSFYKHMYLRTVPVLAAYSGTWAVVSWSGVPNSLAVGSGCVGAAGALILIYRKVYGARTNDRNIWGFVNWLLPDDSDPVSQGSARPAIDLDKDDGDGWDFDPD
jgi:hypothetical protein